MIINNHSNESHTFSSFSAPQSFLDSSIAALKALANLSLTLPYISYEVAPETAKNKCRVLTESTKRQNGKPNIIYYYNYYYCGNSIFAMKSMP